MGYTHYWDRDPLVNEKNFLKVGADFKKMLEPLRKQGVPLAGGNGEGNPVINDKEIVFNGLKNCGHDVHDSDCYGMCGHETFELPVLFDPVHVRDDGSTWTKEPHEDGKFFDFCKTARKQYDLAVQVVLIIAKEHLGDQIVISSDGESEEWEKARELCHEILGYGMTFSMEDE